MSNDQAVFNFELNESLYFERGQEVAEMRGIALDPEISIQAFNEYISIRGVIELRGEYVKTDQQGDGIEELDEYHARRYVERVADKEDGGTEFSHRFPIEISVPTYRVGDMDDVTVSIDSFDYELPNDNQLKFVSTIVIHGISEQAETPRDEDEKADPFTEQEVDTFSFDIKESQDLDQPVKPEPIDYTDVPALSAEKDEAPSPDRWKNKKSQSFAEFFKKEPEPVPEPDPDPPNEESSSFIESSPYPSAESDFVESTFYESSRESNENLEKPENQESVTDRESFESSARPEGSEGAESLASPESSESPVEREDLAHPVNAEIPESTARPESPKSLASPESPARSAGPEIHQQIVKPERKESLEGPEIHESSESRDQSEGVADVRYLSDMFRDDEEHFSSMRVCIVQEKDTLEIIADRYKLTTLQLIKQNRLADETISEGQILYIPLKKN